MSADAAPPGLRPETLKRIALLLATLIFTASGLAFLIWPAESVRALGAEPETTSMLISIRAAKGGFRLGIAAFLWLALAGRRWLTPALLACGLVATGLAVGRILGLVADGWRGEVFHIAVSAAEVLGAVLAFGVLFMARRRSHGKPAKRGGAAPTAAPAPDAAEADDADEPGRTRRHPTTGRE